MDELIGKIASALGIDSSIAEKAIAIILDLLRNHGPEQQVSQLMQQLPGANDLMDRAGGQDSTIDSGSGLGGLLSGALGAVGAGNPLMETLGKLQAAGLDIGQAQTIGQEFMQFAKQHADSELVDEVMNSIPGLSGIA